MKGVHMHKNEKIPGFYEKVYAKKHIAALLMISGYASVLVTAVIFAVRLIQLMCSDMILALRFLTAAFVPFLLVSVLRYVINSERPYEFYHFKENGLPVPKKKLGKSFPSRHVFSAFLIGTLLLPNAAFAGAVVLILGLLLAVSRVLLGIHFIRDTAVGALLGIVSGLIGMLIL